MLECIMCPFALEFSALKHHGIKRWKNYFTPPPLESEKLIHWLMLTSVDNKKTVHVGMSEFFWLLSNFVYQINTLSHGEISHKKNGFPSLKKQTFYYCGLCSFHIFKCFTSIGPTEKKVHRTKKKTNDTMFPIPNNNNIKKFRPLANFIW